MTQVKLSVARSSASVALFLKLAIVGCLAGCGGMVQYRGASARIWGDRLQAVCEKADTRWLEEFEGLRREEICHAKAMLRVVDRDRDVVKSTLAAYVLHRLAPSWQGDRAGRLGGKPEGRSLIEALGEVFRAMGYCDEENAMVIAVEGLRDERAVVRAMGARALGVLGRRARAHVGVLSEKVLGASAESELCVRRECWEAMGRIGGDEAVKVIGAGLNTVRELSEREAMRTGVVNLENAEIGSLLSRTSVRGRESVMLAMERPEARTDQAVNVALMGMRDECEDVREDAIYLILVRLNRLGESGRRELLVRHAELDGQIRKGLGDSSSNVREVAGEVLRLLAKSD